MGIRTIIAIGFALVITSAQAATNSWNFTGSDFWDTDARWSAGHAPNITDFANFITNAAAKTVTIDDTDAAIFQSELTISNLTVMGAGTTTNTLSLTNMNAGALVPLNVLNTLTIGGRGQLQINNSMLHAGTASIATNAVLLFGLGTNSTSVVVSNNLTLGGKLNVANAGGFAMTTYTLFTYGGALINNGLALGSMPTNTAGFIDTSVLGQVNLVVTQGVSGVSSGGVFQIVSIARSTNDILIRWTASAGTNEVQATSGDIHGGYNTNNFLGISGNITVPGGTVTNTYTDLGGATNLPSRFYRVRIVP